MTFSANSQRTGAPPVPWHLSGYQGIFQQHVMEVEQVTEAPTPFEGPTPSTATVAGWLDAVTKADGLSADLVKAAVAHEETLSGLPGPLSRALRDALSWRLHEAGVGL